MTKGASAKRVGSAFLWKAAQHGGREVLFLVRLLVLAHFLTPDEFGLFAVSMVALIVIGQLTNFGLPSALVHQSAVADNHYHAAWTMGMLRGTVITVIVVLAAPLIANLFNEPRATPVIMTLAVLPLVRAACSIKVAELMRGLRFRSLAILSFPDALVNTVVAIALAPALGVWSLVAGTLAGSLAELVLSYVMAPYGPQFSLDRKAIRSLMRFGRWIFLIGLVETFNVFVLRLIITRELGTAALGLYFLSANVAFLISGTVAKLVFEVTFPLYSRLQSESEKISEVFESVLIGSVIAVVPACAMLIALAPAIVELLLGPRWNGSGAIIQILAVVSILNLLVAVSDPLLQAAGQASRVLVILIVQSLILFPLMWVFSQFLGLPGAALAWLPAVAAAQVLNAYYLRRLLPEPFKALGKRLFVILSFSAASALLAAAIFRLVPGLMGLMLSVSVSVTALGLGLWLLDRRLGLGLADNMLRAFPWLSGLHQFRLAGYRTRDGSLS